MPRIRRQPRPLSFRRPVRVPREGNIVHVQSAPRCGAQTRAGTPCRAPAVSGRSRCRMHGGAKGTGAPHGNRNAYRHGKYAAAERVRRAGLRALIREYEASLLHISARIAQRDGGMQLPQPFGAWGCSSEKMSDGTAARAPRPSTRAQDEALWHEKPGSPPLILSPSKDEVRWREKPGAPSRILSLSKDEALSRAKPDSPSRILSLSKDEALSRAKPGSPPRIQSLSKDEARWRAKPGSPSRILRSSKAAARSRAKPGSPPLILSLSKDEGRRADRRVLVRPRIASPRLAPYLPAKRVHRRAIR